MNSLKVNKDIEPKSGTIEQACLRYGLGANSMRETAKAAGAIVKIGRRVLVNFSKLDDYIDSLSE